MSSAILAMDYSPSVPLPISQYPQLQAPVTSPFPLLSPPSVVRDKVRTSNSKYNKCKNLLGKNERIGLQEKGTETRPV